MKDKKFKKITIKSVPHLPELISGASYLLDCNGIEETQDELIFYLNNFKEEDELFLKNFLSGLIKENLLENFLLNVDEVDEKNWNEEWEKFIKPIKVTERIVIKPSFADYTANRDEIVLTIDPKMSFGTGHHQTTRLMIRLIEKYIKTGDKVLDVGTGSGILAVISAKLGASETIALDIDEDVKDNVIENLRMNNVLEKCRFFAGTIENLMENDFDVVLANIQKNVLIEIANQIKIKTKIGGIIILSGLLSEDGNDIENVYSSLNFAFVDKMQEDEWIGIVYKNSG